MSAEFRVIGDPVFEISKNDLLERDERTRTVSSSRLRKVLKDEFDDGITEAYAIELLRALGFAVK